MFLLHKIDGSDLSFSPEYLPCSAIQPLVGLAMTQSGGNLAVCTGTKKPTYISLCERETACAAGDIIPVLRVRPDMVFKTIFSNSAASIKPGDKVTIDSYGQAVTATTTDGVAEVVRIDSTDAGGECYVRFP